MTSFQELNLSPETLRAIEAMGFEEPTPIQARAVPPAISGRDLIGQAQTGTGKTAAFGLPIIERIGSKNKVPAAMVITPTRELCLQVAGELAKLGKFKGLTTLPIYGGQSIDRQIRALVRGVDVVIGTPGRLLDHLRRGTLNLQSVQIVVLDEADEMLDMGFIDDIEAILNDVPAKRQTMLFSATMPDPILRLARRYLRDPERIAVSPEAVTVPQIEQVYYEISGHDRVDSLARILDMEGIDKAIIFCRTKKGADELSEDLKGRGYLAEAIHGDLTQRERERVMRRFRAGQIELLVATDVAARGLDIENITHVINYEIPQDPESYVHRIGRTGRAGKEGEAITLIHPKEFRQLRQIERVTRSRITRREVPSLKDLIDRKRDVIKAKLRTMWSRGALSEYRTVVTEFLEEEECDSLDVAAAALKLWAGDHEPVEQPSEDTGAERGMVRLFVNIGRDQGIGPADIVRSFAQESGISGNLIGLIKIYDRFTFVEVPEETRHQVIQAMREATIKGRAINVEPARPR